MQATNDIPPYIDGVVPDIPGDRLVVHEDRAVVLALQLRAPAVQAFGALVEEHLGLSDMFK
jgi:hypothetical protein